MSTKDMESLDRTGVDPEENKRSIQLGTFKHRPSETDLKTLSPSKGKS